MDSLQTCKYSDVPLGRLKYVFSSWTTYSFSPDYIWTHRDHLNINILLSINYPVM